MKAVLRILTVVFLILAIMFFVQAGLVQYLYSVRIEQQLKLADDASMPQAKLEYLVKYKEAVIKNIDRNEARYIFKQERLTKKEQLIILDSLIQRLTDVSAMLPDSLSYQQGMQQISGQEFDHTLTSINDIFYVCYIRDSFIGRFAPLVFGPICLFVFFVFLV